MWTEMKTNFTEELEVKIVKGIWNLTTWNLHWSYQNNLKRNSFMNRVSCQFMKD